MSKTPTDPLRSNLLELIQDIEHRTSQLRDFASTPGNIWLAKGELQHLMQIMSELESILEDIKQQDAENGY